MHDEVLSSVSLLISRSGKNRKTEGLQGKKSQKKTTSCNTDLCVTQGRLILVFSWVLSGYQFLPFWKKLRMRGVTLKYLVLFPLALENCNLNNFVWVFLHTLSGVFRLSAKYGLSRFLLSSCCHANNDMIHANCRFLIDFVKGITSAL